MATLLIPGIPDPRPERSDLGRGLPAGAVTTRYSARVEAARGADVQRVEGVQPDDIVEIELEDGLRLWTRVDDLERDLGRAGARGVAEDAIEVPALLSLGPRSRGWAAWGIKALKVLGIDVAKSIGDFVADHVESRLSPGPGLYRCSDSQSTPLGPIGRGLDGKGPTLVFLHGTASSTMGSFGALWNGGGSAPISRLLTHYGGRVLALQHETLTKSPVENAAFVAERLLELLDGEAEIHLVSHSRGGLVGELLARAMRIGSAPITGEEVALFDGPGRARDRAALQALNRTLQKARLQVTRFVRVACPARGTTLADRRLDRYFSILVNIAGLIPGLKGNPVYDGLTSLLAAVLKQRTKPEDLPGLEAQMPGSPLVLMLNQPGVRTRADLHVLGGDLEGTGIFGRLKTLATDLYYRDDHDLVVNTPSMFGGAHREGGVQYWIDTGASVTHFHYFMNADTASRLVGVLTEGRGDFHALTAEPFAVTADDYRKRAAVPQPVVFVLPGIMGSELSVGKRAIWMELFALANGGLAGLRTGVAAEVTGLIRSGYGELCRHLAATHDVVPFGYDWRLSVEESAEALRRAIEARLPQAEAEQQPIRLLAHSMGGLVVRAMVATPAGKQTWDRMCRHPGARFIMLGTPNRGSHAIPAMLIGRDALVKKLALLDVKHDYAGLLETIAGFQGVLDLLPDSGGFFDTAAWQTLFANDVPSDRGLFSSGVASSKSAGFAWTVPAATTLARARAGRERIASSPIDPARMIYVAGVADETACDVVVDETAPEGRRVRVLASARGDGRVLWNTGIPAGVRVFYMDAVHGDLASTESAFPALQDLLTTGTTTKLPTTAPRGRAAADEPFEMRDPLPAMLPDRDELVASALGAKRRPVRIAAPSRRTEVRVVHDDLSNATSPVLVGHYEHDLIVAAEAYLDRKLDGRLSELRRMELYPGPIGTSVAVLNSDEPGDSQQHPGAIVSGLGMVGELTAGRLTHTLAQALTTYGAECVGQERRRRQRAGGGADQPPFTIGIPVTALLVGSGEAGVSLSDSIQALLRAVVMANDRLAMATTTAHVADPEKSRTLTAFIERVDIVELYEDRAIEAVHALRNLARSPELARFVLADLLAVGPQGQRRARPEPAHEWWQRVRVTARRDGGLRFEALTQRAGVPARLRPTQWQAVNAFLKRATETTAFDASLGYTLFEILVPNEFKMLAPDRRKLVLVMDEKAAAVPWELLHDRYERGSRPLAVASGMIRQLLVDAERAQIARAPSNTALVVGNPLVRDPRFPPLPGAEDEANAVATTLSARGYQVVSFLGTAATPMAVLTAVHQQPWRIVHLAAHGVFRFSPRPDAPPVSGLVLDDGVFFSAADAIQMRHVPDVVFINCCHLGQTSGEAPLFTQFHELAANLSVQFIKMGARAVVAAGWAVDDAAAKTFARAFYEEMFAGLAFGDAVGRARERVFEAHAATNTWGAYQCYGDPGFSLVNTTVSSVSEPPVADVEVILAAERIARGARAASAEECAQLGRQLEALVGTVPEAWWVSPRLCAAVGAAYRELFDFEPALRYYERVRTAPKADAPIAALEQLANVKVLLAATLGERDARARRRALEELRSAEALLRRLLAIGPTSERFNLLGSLQKRRAMLTTGASRRRALAEMRDAYQRGFEQAFRISAAEAAYPLANRLAAQVVESWRAAPSRAAVDGTAGSLDKGLAELGDIATELRKSSTRFFDFSSRADHTLLTALKARALEPPVRQQVVTEYAQAGRRGVSPRDRASMRDQIAFFEKMARTELRPAAARDKLVASLAALRESLAAV